MLLAEALDAGVGVRTVYVEPDTAGDDVLDVVARARAAGVAVRDVVPGALAKVLDLVTPRPVVAVVDLHLVAPADVIDAALGTQRPVLVLVDVADPGNVGTLVRVAEAAGCAGVVLVGACADLHNPKTVRATAGAVFRVPTAPADEPHAVLAMLREAGVAVLGTTGGGGVAPEQAALGGAVAIVVGSEAHGLAPEVLAGCDQLVSIPMDGAVESLNAAVAGSVLAFEAARQRRAGAIVAPGVQQSGPTTAPLGHNDDPVAPEQPEGLAAAPEHGSPPR